MPQRERRKPIDWRGRPTRAAREVTEECARAWGVVVEGQREPYYVTALPDAERRHEP